jgi:hypothetical protein
MRKSRSAIVTLAILVICSTSGCSFLSAGQDEVPSTEEIEGNWTATGPRGEISTLEFESDGTFAADFPRDLFTSSLRSPEDFDWTTTIEGTGTWTIGEVDKGTPQRVDFVLTSTNQPGIGATFYVQGPVNARELYGYVGPVDFGQEFVFTKTD